MAIFYGFHWILRESFRSIQGMKDFWTLPTSIFIEKYLSHFSCNKIKTIKVSKILKQSFFKCNRASTEKRVEKCYLEHRIGACAFPWKSRSWKMFVFFHQPSKIRCFHQFNIRDFSLKDRAIQIRRAKLLISIWKERKFTINFKN